MNSILYKLSIANHGGGEDANAFLEKLEALETKLLAAENEVRYRTPAAPVIGVNAEKYSLPPAISSARPRSAHASRMASPGSTRFAGMTAADVQGEEEEGDMEFEEEGEGIIEMEDDGGYVSMGSEEDVDAYGVLEDSGASGSTLIRD